MNELGTPNDYLLHRNHAWVPLVATIPFAGYLAIAGGIYAWVAVAIMCTNLVSTYFLIAAAFYRGQTEGMRYIRSLRA